MRLPWAVASVCLHALLCTFILMLLPSSSYNHSGAQSPLILGNLLWDSHGFISSISESVSAFLGGSPPSCFMGGIFSGKARQELGGQSASNTLYGSHSSSHLYGAGTGVPPPSFIPFSELLCESQCEKQQHFFGHMYSEYLDALRTLRAQQGQGVNMLEVGIKDGGSLPLWVKAFPQGTIFGLDIFPILLHQEKMQALLGAADASRVHIFRGDQANTRHLNRVAEAIRAQVGELDVIVDDGGHTMAQQITSFTHLFPLLRPGGLYFIEDMQTSYWAKTCNHFPPIGQPYCYGGRPPGEPGTAIALIKSLIDVLNADFIEDHARLSAIGSGNYSVNPVDGLVGSVQCWRNMCVMRRKFEGTFF